VNKYSQLKMDLIKEKDMIREEYTKRKTEFIISVLTSIGLDEKELSEIKKCNHLKRQKKIASRLVACVNRFIV
jgi:hypothetical protein